MSVAKGSDELWVGVKCQANPEIAGSPRNASRCSLQGGPRGLSTESARGLAAYRPESTSEYRGTDTWGVRRRVRRFVAEKGTTLTVG